MDDRALAANFAEALRTERERRSLTRAELAAGLRLREQVVAFLESGGKLRQPPPQPLVVALERALGIDDSVLQVAAGYPVMAGATTAVTDRDRLDIILQQLGGLGLDDEDSRHIVEMIRQAAD